MLLISGLSGAGKSTVLHALEDAGFFCTDNLPLEMLSAWAVSMHGRKQQAAVCLDARSGFTAQAIRATIESSHLPDDTKLLFIEADDAVLQRRFSTVRRRHPYHSGTELMLSIAQEREALMPIRAMADLILDSSHLTPYELADRVEQYWRDPAHYRPQLACSICSFSFRNGLPASADLVYDMRFLPNPHYQPELARQTGRDQGVIDFLQALPEVAETRQHIQAYLRFIWPHLERERKHYFMIAFGCSGGRHRSVYMAESVAAWLREEGMAQANILHRELQMDALQQHTAEEEAG